MSVLNLSMGTCLIQLCAAIQFIIFSKILRGLNTSESVIEEKPADVSGRQSDLHLVA
jgi:hypothetical protein